MRTVGFLPLLFTLTCSLSVAAMLWFDWKRQAGLGPVLSKLTASVCFLLLAVSLGAWHSSYGSWVLAALALGCIGDALLLSRAERAFMGGLLAFLAAHVLLTVAFVSGSWAWEVFWPVGLLCTGLGLGILRWLLPHTPDHFKWPVRVYVGVILAMCTWATAHAQATGQTLIVLGAWLFALSDIAVARDRFIRQSRWNKIWGWPTYYAAQLMLAWSVLGA